MYGKWEVVYISIRGRYSSGLGNCISGIGLGWGIDWIKIDTGTGTHYSDALAGNRVL